MAKASTVKNIDKEGILQELHLWFNDNIPKDRSFRFSGDISECITAKDIRIYPVQESAEVIGTRGEHPVYGEYDEAGKGNKHYYNVIVEADLEFSKATYYKYWHEICKHLEYNTNVFVHKKPKIHPVREIHEFDKISSASTSITYKFIRECTKRRYIVKLIYDNDALFIANPKYVTMGRYLPITLRDLLETAEHYHQEHNEEE